MAAFSALRRREDFRRTMRDGQRAAEGGLTVFARRREPTGEVRFGCLVIARAAVARNRGRRRAREALAEAGPPEGLDVVVRIEEGAIELPFQKMVEAMRKAFRGVARDAS